MEKEVRFVNLTPHSIVIFKGEQPVMEIPPSGRVARVSVSQREVTKFKGIPVKRTEFGEVEGLPEFLEPDKVYIVSIIVLQAFKREHGYLPENLVAPDTSPFGAVRDSEGKLIGVRGFQTI